VMCLLLFKTVSAAMHRSDHVPVTRYPANDQLHELCLGHVSPSSLDLQSVVHCLDCALRSTDGLEPPPQMLHAC